jgi:hypothetical protein
MSESLFLLNNRLQKLREGVVLYTTLHLSKEKALEVITEKVNNITSEDLLSEEKCKSEVRALEDKISLLKDNREREVERFAKVKDQLETEKQALTTMTEKLRSQIKAAELKVEELNKQVEELSKKADEDSIVNEFFGGIDASFEEEVASIKSKMLQNLSDQLKDSDKKTRLVHKETSEKVTTSSKKTKLEFVEDPEEFEFSSPEELRSKKDTKLPLAKKSRVSKVNKLSESESESSESSKSEDSEDSQPKKRATPPTPPTPVNRKPNFKSPPPRSSSEEFKFQVNEDEVSTEDHKGREMVYKRSDIDEDSAAVKIEDPDTLQLMLKELKTRAGKRITSKEKKKAAEFWNYIKNDISEADPVDEKVFLHVREKKGNDCTLCKVKISIGDQCVYGFSRITPDNEPVLCTKHPMHVHCGAFLKSLTNKDYGYHVCIGMAGDNNDKDKRFGQIARCVN